MVQKNSIAEQLIFVVGPTSTGKSDFSIELAKRLNGAVISADSMQIYREMNIGTAKIRPEEYDGIEHYMLDIVDPDQEYSVAQYKEDAEKVIDEVIKGGKKPIITGGTGLYTDSLIFPLSYGNAQKNEDLRKVLKEELDNFGPLFIHEKLKQIDHKTAERLHPNNTRRVIRAIEIALTEGPMSENADSKVPIRNYLMVGLNLERAELYERINQRVDKMFNLGLLREVTELKEKYPFTLQAMQAIGYKEFRPYFDGEINLEEVKELIKKNTRNYAKRQITWFKRYGNIVWFNPVTEKENAFNYIERNL